MLHTCPPIPPNHALFDEKYKEFHWPDTFHWELTVDIGRENRSVIAAVAYRAWMKIAVPRARQNSKLTDKEIAERAIARKNAEAWDAWGEE
jgi:hypothetical protein